MNAIVTSGDTAGSAVRHVAVPGEASLFRLTAGMTGSRRRRGTLVIAIYERAHIPELRPTGSEEDGVRTRPSEVRAPGVGAEPYEGVGLVREADLQHPEALAPGVPETMFTAPSARGEPCIVRP